MPGFLTLDRIDLDARAGAEVSHLVRDGANVSVIDMHASYVVPDTRFGVYGAVPIVRVADDDESYKRLELAGFYSRRLAANRQLVMHAGIAMHWPPSDQLDRASVIAAPIRLVDVAPMFTDGTTLRLGASYLRHQGAWFGRVDVGLDHGFASADDQESRRTGHIAGGLGVSLGVVTITAELALTPDYGTAALGARWTFGRAQPYAGVVLPIEDDAQALGDVAVTAGVEVLFACPQPP